MKLAPTLALAVLAACTTPLPAVQAPRAAPERAAPTASEAPRPARALAPSPELAALSRAMTEIDDAERIGTAPAERARRAAAVAIDPWSVTARFLATYAQPHGEEAWTEFRALGKEARGGALGAIGMARLYVEWRVLDQVPRVLARAAEAEPGNWLVDLVRAQADERGERDAEAAAGYRAVLSADPGNVDAQVGLARLAVRAGDPVAARAGAEAALGALPAHAPALAVLAGLAAAAGDDEAAVTQARKLVAASPRDRAARVALARRLEARGDAAGAREQWRQVVALREEPEALLALAGTSRRSGDREGEARALDRLSQLDPGGAEWKRIADLRRAEGDAAGAEKALRRALARDPKDAAAALALGQVLAFGSPQEALGHLRAAGPAGDVDRQALERRLQVEGPARGDLAAIQRAVGRLIDRAYRARLAEAPRLSGRITVRVTVDGAGGTTLVEVLDDTVHDEDVRACAYWNLKDAAYPPNKPGRYSFAFTLRPGG